MLERLYFDTVGYLEQPIPGRMTLKVLPREYADYRPMNTTCGTRYDFHPVEWKAYGIDTFTIKDASNMNTENRLTRLYRLLDEALSCGRAKVAVTLRKEIAQVEAAYQKQFEYEIAERRKADAEELTRLRGLELDQLGAEQLAETKPTKSQSDIPAFVVGTLLGACLVVIGTYLL